MASALEGEQTVFNHVGICVTDLERSKKFYEEVLRFRYWWELEAPDEGTSQLLQIPAPVGDIPTALEKVPQHGGEVMVDTDMTAAIMIRDPDGQLIELTSAGWLDVLPPLPE